MASLFKGVAEFVMPVLKTSAFLEKGVLTPEEFVAAGDQLVGKCRTWQWAAGDKANAKKYLPADKQFLITRNVPSLKRAQTYAMADAKEAMVETSGDTDFGDGWLNTHVDDFGDEKKSPAPSSTATSTPSTTTTTTTTTGAPTPSTATATAPVAVAAPAKAASTAKPAPAAADDDAPDLDAVLDDNVVEPVRDDNNDLEALEADPGTLSFAPGAGGVIRTSEPEDNIVRTRTYDISIVYDKYYQTPRVFLFGYDEHRTPLTSEQIMQDISSEHANKTVTVDPHPHLGVAHASIHPCKHASVMKKIVDMISGVDDSVAPAKSGAPAKAERLAVAVDQYMFLFLKFISTVIPTIEYDYTLSA